MRWKQERRHGTIGNRRVSASVDSEDQAGFSKPFEAHNTTESALDRRDDSTNVTWAIDGPQPYMMKVMSIFINSDKMVGGQFETGLGNLKALAEK